VGVDEEEVTGRMFLMCGDFGNKRKKKRGGFEQKGSWGKKKKS